jgi:RNA polymerase sigma factor (sigma-70 family)
VSTATCPSEFEKLVRLHYPSIVNYLSGRLRNVSDAEDIAQESLLRLIEQYKLGKKIRCPQALLFSIARNLSTDLLRRNVRTKTRFDHSVDDVQLLQVRSEDTESDPETCCINHEIVNVVRDSLASVSERYLRIFDLTKLEDYTYPEAAAASQLSVSMIEKYVSRAIHHLRKDQQILNALA